MSHVMTSITEDSIVNCFTHPYRKYSNQSGHTWLLPKVVCCPDGHYHQAIFLLGPCYRIVGQVKITIFILVYNPQPDYALHSHLQPISLMQIFMKCCHQIFSINLLKVLSRIIWSCGSMTISKAIIWISRWGKYWMKLTFGKHILSRFWM